MAWKSKEKELTREEALELLKQETAPFWAPPPPMFAAVDVGGEAAVYAVHPDFESHSWLVHFIDPTSVSGETMTHYAQLWDHRYSRYGLKTALVLFPRYEHFLQRSSLEAYAAYHKLRFPLAVDHNLMLAKAFRVISYPFTLLIRQGKPVTETAGIQVERMDSALQDFFRKSDPGLPLPPTLEWDPAFFVDVGSVELGKGRGCVFAAAKPGVPAEPGKIHAAGKWEQDAEGIVTSDKSAYLVLKCPSSGFALTGLSKAKTIEGGKIQLEINDVPAYDAYADRDMMHEEGLGSIVLLGDTRLYRALNQLPADCREITLRFPTADRVPVGILGFRFFK